MSFLLGSGAFKRKKNNSSSDSEDTKKLKNKKKARFTGDLVNKRSGDESGRVGENRTQSMSSEYGNSSAGENINNTGSLPKKEKKTGKLLMLRHYNSGAVVLGDFERMSV